MFLRLNATALVVGLLFGCAGSAKLRKGQLEGRTIRAMNLVGNRHFSDSALLAVLATRATKEFLHLGKPRRYDERALRLDRKRILAFYREHGYFSTRVTGLDVKKSGRTGVTIRLEIDEGDATQVTRAEILGLPPNTGIDANTILGHHDVAPGKVLVHADYLAAKRALSDALVEHSYVHAKVDGKIRVDRDAHTAEIELRVAPGPRVSFGRILLAGNRRIPDDTILSRVTWKRGAPFDIDKVMQTRKSLIELGAFSSVRIDYARDGRPTAPDVTIAVAEADPNELKLGGGASADSTTVELRGRAHYSRHGFIHPLIDVGADVLPKYTLLPGRDEKGQAFVDFGVRMSKQDFLVTHLTAASSLSVESDRFPGYSARGQRTRANLTRPLLGDALRLSVGWQLRLLDVDANDPALEDTLGVAGLYRLGFFEQSLTYDGRDNPIFPRGGSFAQLAVEEGTSAAGGVFAYTKATIDVRTYVGLSPRFVLGARARAGLADSAGGADVPITQRFYSGGNNHRGFDRRRLSPEIAETDGDLIPIGGTALAELGLELRARIGSLWEFPVRTGLFVDAGDVVSRAGELSATELHWAVGAGLRLDLPVGPLRVDIGRRLNRLGATGPGGRANPDPENAWAIHLSLGEAF